MISSVIEGAGGHRRRRARTGGERCIVTKVHSYSGGGGPFQVKRRKPTRCDVPVTGSSSWEDRGPLKFEVRRL